MAGLSKRLQAKSSRTHQSEEPTQLYGYKEFELQAGLLGPEDL